MLKFKVQFSFSLFMLAMGFVSVSHANICKNAEDITHVLKNAGLGTTEQGLLDCKVLPQQQDRAVIAVALPVEQTVEPDYAEYALSLVTVHAYTGELIQTYTDPKVIVSDAVALSGIKLDTAAYQLNAKQRAIGVRLNFTGASRVNPYNPQLLNLYNLKTRQKVLDSFVVALERGEWDGNCEGEWEKHSSLLQMLKTKNKGYTDIKVTSKDHSYQTQERKRECATVNQKTVTENFILKFDGEQYQAPKQYRDKYYD